MWLNIYQKKNLNNFNNLKLKVNLKNFLESERLNDEKADIEEFNSFLECDSGHGAICDSDTLTGMDGKSSDEHCPEGF